MSTVLSTSSSLRASDRKRCATRRRMHSSQYSYRLHTCAGNLTQYNINPQTFCQQQFSIPPEQLPRSRCRATVEARPSAPSFLSFSIWSFGPTASKLDKPVYVFDPEANLPSCHAALPASFAAPAATLPAPAATCALVMPRFFHTLPRSSRCDAHLLSPLLRRETIIPLFHPVPDRRRRRADAVGDVPARGLLRLGEARGRGWGRAGGAFWR